MTDTEKIERLRNALEEIQRLVSWHYDPDADPNDQSPKDMTAHVNGLVYRLCEEGIRINTD